MKNRRVAGEKVMEQGLLPPKGAKQNGGTEGLCFFSLNGAEEEGKGAKRRSHTDCTGPISGMRSSVALSIVFYFKKSIQVNSELQLLF